MNKRLEAAIIRMSDSGYTVKAIAEYHLITQTSIRSVLRLHRLAARGHNIHRRESLDKLERAKILMLDAGYDPAIVEANFG